MAEPPLTQAGGAGAPVPGVNEGASGRPPLTARRLFGLDRSGPAPVETEAGQPLRPWTIPNAIGFIRLALIPVFLIVALSSGDGTGASIAILFAVIGWGDYADGMAARVTGQYSRLGALMDPVTDRMLVICGVIVTWKFDLLPHWALAVLAIRELLMLVLGRWALSRGAELRINWPGRLGVAPVMGSFFFAMAGLPVVAEVMLYVGLALALLASYMYGQSAIAQIRAQARP